MKNPADSPFQVGKAPIANSNGDNSSAVQFYSKTAADEEEKAHSHTNLPHTIQNIVSQIGEVFVKMVYIRKALGETEQISDKKHSLEAMINKIDNINKQVFELTNDLNDLNLVK